jgi:undecaprenyl-diphosphatase
VRLFGAITLFPSFALWCGQIAGRRIRDWDAAISGWCYRPEQRRAWLLFTRMGDGWFYALVYLLAYYSGQTAVAHRVAASCFLAWGIGSLLKVTVRRKRPSRYKGWSVRERMYRWSFPSQHAAVSVAFAYALWPSPFAAGLAALICCSRVLVGAHYLGDVLAGVAVGLLAGRLA